MIELTVAALMFLAIAIGMVTLVFGIRKELEEKAGVCQYLADASTVLDRMKRTTPLSVNDAWRSR